MSKKEEFLTALRTWVGTPYHLDGSCKQVGTNCSHFILDEIISKIGVTAPEVLKCKGIRHMKLFRDDPTAIIIALNSFCRRVPPEQIQPGDIAVLKFGPLPAQIVAYGGDMKFFYCTRTAGVVFRPLTVPLAKRAIGVWRPRVFEEES